MFRFLPVVCLLLSLLGCVSSASINVQGSHQLSVHKGQANAVEEKSFLAWRTHFIQRAIAQGIDTNTANGVMANAQFMPSITALDGKQPEFSKHIWSYLNSAISTNRIQQGRKKMLEQQALLNQLAQQYNVAPEMIVAIWGLETAYGANTGKSNLPSALSTLAFEGRRREFAEEQLLALMRLVSRGDIRLTQLQGSWAGGMGQTQFIPTTYMKYAVDGDGDGRRDLWQTADALASTANYLHNAGWRAGLPWGIEVILPPDFSDKYVGMTQPWAAWQALGIRPAGKNSLSASATATLWLPGGIHGPALLVTDNFDVIKVYNNASSYALSACLLADALAGRDGLHTPWPRDALALSQAQIVQLQQRLQQLGFALGKIDGVVGQHTRNAFQQWQRSRHIFADGFISQQTAKELLQ